MSLTEPISLSRLTSEIRGVMSNAFFGKFYWVTAEVSNLSYYKAKGTWYFDLCEKDQVGNRVVALLKSVAFGEAAEEILNFERITSQTFTNGLQVLVQVEVTYHEVYGMQLRMRRINPFFTLGNLERARQLTLERLVRENPEHILFDNGVYTSSNKRTGLPRVFEQLAVISSANSAGLQDFLHTIENNDFGFRFKTDLYITEVQGVENAQKMVAELIKIFYSGVKYDAVAILRGGGAQSDFLLFDTYEIARAVARFPIPVITGIGHQKNETLVDLMACCFTKTPTQAAELIISVNHKFEDSLLSLRRGMLIKVQQRLSYEKELIARLSKIFTRDSFKLIEKEDQMLSRVKVNVSLLATGRLAKNRINLLNALQGLVSATNVYKTNQKREVALAGDKLFDLANRYLMNRTSSLGHYKKLFDLMDIRKTLNRGFAVVRTGGRIISEGRGINAGESISIDMQDATLGVRVDTVEPVAVTP